MTPDLRGELLTMKFTTPGEIEKRRRGCGTIHDFGRLRFSLFWGVVGGLITGVLSPCISFLVYRRPGLLSAENLLASLLAWCVVISVVAFLKWQQNEKKYRANRE